MLCNSEWFTYAFYQSIWSPSNLVNYPDDDRDCDRNMSVVKIILYM